MNYTDEYTISDFVDEIYDYVNYNFDQESTNEFVWNEIQGYLNNITKMEDSEELDVDTIISIAPKSLKFSVFEILEDYLSDEQYWSNLAGVYRSTEFRNEELIEKFSADRENKSAMMDKEDFEVMSQFPEIITIYRGCTTSNFDGISWTTSKEIAQRFAKRNSLFNKEEGIVREMQISKIDITAYFDGEKEILYIN